MRTDGCLQSESGVTENSEWIQPGAAGFPFQAGQEIICAGLPPLLPRIITDDVQLGKKKQATLGGP